MSSFGGGDDEEFGCRDGDDATGDRWKSRLTAFVILDVTAALENVCNWMSMFRLMTLRVAEASASKSASRRPDMDDGSRNDLRDKIQFYKKFYGIYET